MNPNTILSPMSFEACQTSGKRIADEKHGYQPQSEHEIPMQPRMVHTTHISFFLPVSPFSLGSISLSLPLRSRIQPHHSSAAKTAKTFKW